MLDQFYNHDFRDSPNIQDESERRAFATKVLLVVAVLTLLTLCVAVGLYFVTPNLVSGFSSMSVRSVSRARILLWLPFLPLVFDQKIRESALGLGPVNVVAPILVAYYVLVQGAYAALFVYLGAAVNKTATIHVATIAAVFYAILYVSLFVNRANLAFIRTYLCFLAGAVVATLVFFFTIPFGTAEWAAVVVSILTAAWIIHYDSLKLYEAREDEIELAIIEVFTPLLVFNEIAQCTRTRRGGW